MLLSLPSEWSVNMVHLEIHLVTITYQIIEHFLNTCQCNTLDCSKVDIYYQTSMFVSLAS